MLALRVHLVGDAEAHKPTGAAKLFDHVHQRPRAERRAVLRRLSITERVPSALQGRLAEMRAPQGQTIAAIKSMGKIVNAVAQADGSQRIPLVAGGIYRLTFA